MQTVRGVAFLAANLVIIHRKLSTVNLEKEFDESNPYMRFGINWVINI